MKEINECRPTIIRVNTTTREKLNEIRKEISQATSFNISTDNLINLMLNAFEHKKISSFVCQL